MPYEGEGREYMERRVESTERKRVMARRIFYDPQIELIWQSEKTKEKATAENAEFAESIDFASTLYLFSLRTLTQCFSLRVEA